MRKVLLFCIMVVLSVGIVVPGDVFAGSDLGKPGSPDEPSLGKPGSPNEPSLGKPGSPNEPAPECKAGQACLKNPLSNISSIPAFFKAIIEILMIFAIPFIVFFIIYAGFLYVTARGNAEAIQKAHRALLYALLGGLLILGASLLLNIITGTVNDIIK